ncbi:hypothetical protein E2C01_038983 [Portunus trituberculatus]|uniref:Uncharacterized protein n=1 Tax=Portunus trituberculatus TaxID=210409 RepID=A0A5B7FIC5_PORTR|nr:hypothetical protein [Portunus trituberculatus]
MHTHTTLHLHAKAGFIKSMVSTNETALVWDHVDEPAGAGKTVAEKCANGFLQPWQQPAGQLEECWSL